VSVIRLILLLVPIMFLQACAPALVAGAATGAAVAHDRRTFGAMIDDQTIELKIGSRIASDPSLREQTHINVTSMNGVVLLTGEARTPDSRDQILARAREVNGIRRITNEIIIGEPSSLGSRSKDALITSAIKSRLIVTRNLDASRIKIVTESGVAYLMGIVTQAEAETATQQTLTIDGIVRVVKVFEYLD